MTRARPQPRVVAQSVKMTLRETVMEAPHNLRFHARLLRTLARQWRDAWAPGEVRL